MKHKLLIQRVPYKALGFGLLMSAAISCQKMEGLNADQKLLSDLDLQQDAKRRGLPFAGHDE